MSDAQTIIIWWLTILALGTTSLPLTWQLFPHFFDRGYLFSKILGLLFSAYFIWLLASLHLLPFQRITILLVSCGVLIANLWFFRRKNEEKEKPPWMIFLFEEILFLFALFFWAFIRAHEPSIHGLEKFMDFGFVNSILRANFFPPLDMWLAKSPEYLGGFYINYYYFGHYLAAFLTKLSGLEPAITYNLMLSSLFAFTFTFSFSLGANLSFLFFKKNFPKESPAIFSPFVVGFLAAFLVSLGGNLHTLYVFTEGYPNENPVPFWKLKLGFYPERYWYPNATRFIPFTIHEFPIYSFVVADLHGHVSDIPLVLLFLAFLLAIATQEILPEKKNSSLQSSFGFLEEFKARTSFSLPFVFLLGLSTGVMYMTNAWDGLIYLLLASLVIFYRLFKRAVLEGKSFAEAFFQTFSTLLFLVFFFLLTTLPFSLNFRPFVSGVGVLCAPKSLLGKQLGPFLFEEGKCQKSPLYMLFLLWGFFYYHLVAFVATVLFPKIRSWLRENPSSSPKKNSQKFLVFLPPTDIFVLILGFLSTLLLIFPEFFYLKDIYPAHYRANTMFKLGYQAFMMLGLSSAYIIFRLRHLPRRNFFFHFYKFGFLLLFTLVAIYPYFAINSYYGNLKNYLGLYGLNWLENQYPDDYQGILWLQKNVKCFDLTEKECRPQPVIAEANGDSYTDYARVSANTGLPTIVGWPVHEWLWRGSFDEAGKRIPEVALIYEGKDLSQIQEILRKYKVEYIFLGTLEREKYKNLREENLEKLGQVVFERGKTKIYKVKENF